MRQVDVRKVRPKNDKKNTLLSCTFRVATLFAVDKTRTLGGF